jgi:hypothetical protein
MKEVKTLSVGGFGTSGLSLHLRLDLIDCFGVPLNVILKLFDAGVLVCHDENESTNVTVLEKWKQFK